MKTCIAFLLIALLLPGTAGCKKDKKVYPTYPPPGWEKQPDGKYPYSMTAVLRLPNDLGAGYKENDELAAFIGEECRSVAVPVDVEGARLFYFLIQGAAVENERIVFKYYSSGSSYMYASDPIIEFKADGNYGTADQPWTLVLKHL
ncbi:MAG TPA: hypothetical protein VD772_08350 [Anseongella sp.]|nr:hypothetical protein [Anseongella sp.]